MIALLVLAAFSLVSLHGQVNPRDTLLSVREPRPLAKLAELLEQRFGIPISYEDVAYANEGDVVDKTDPDYRKVHPGVSVVIPRSGSVELRIPAGAQIRTSLDAIPLLQIALDAHTKAGNPGEFIVRQAGSGLVIVPSRVRNSSGVLLPDPSPLDARISFTELQRSAQETLDTICAAIGGSSGKSVKPGLTPFGTGIGSYVVTLGARNETARDVLLRMFANLRWSNPAATGPIMKMGWRLFYAPDSKTYALNIHAIRVETMSPDGRTLLLNVPR